MAKKKKTSTCSEEQTESQPGTDKQPEFPLLRVCGLFMALVLGLHLVMWQLVSYRFLAEYQLFTARIVASLLTATGVPVLLDSIYLRLGSVLWEVSLECTALTAMIVFASFVVAYPASLRSKLIGGSAGIPLLFLANLLRLLALGHVTMRLPRVAEVMHDYVWQVAFLFLVALLWLAWLELVVKREKCAVVSC